MIRKLKLQEILIRWIKSLGWTLLFTWCIRVLLLEIPWSILFVVVTHVMSLLFFYTPWKYQKVSGFLMFSGGIERNHWHEIGYLVSAASLFLQMEDLIPECFLETLWIKSFVRETVDTTPWFWLEIILFLTYLLRYTKFYGILVLNLRYRNRITKCEFKDLKFKRIHFLQNYFMISENWQGWQYASKNESANCEFY